MRFADKVKLLENNELVKYFEPIYRKLNTKHPDSSTRMPSGHNCSIRKGYNNDALAIISDLEHIIKENPYNANAKDSSTYLCYLFEVENLGNMSKMKPGENFYWYRFLVTVDKETYHKLQNAISLFTTIVFEKPTTMFVDSEIDKMIGDEDLYTKADYEIKIISLYEFAMPDKEYI